ncbi:lactate racemase domain-containing protein [Puniceicoccaceae bacterium K14]|nr:lactate racemase domain-containing protein [Puniceicoccaceae bacterium K14]
MSTYYAKGSPTTSLSDDELKAAMHEIFEKLGDRKAVLALPPDFTRFYSKAGYLTDVTAEFYGDSLIDVMPALGTHKPMSDEQLDIMFPNTPKEKVRPHDWRNDVVTVGEVPAEYCSSVTGGIWDKAWPAQMNKMVRDGGHDLVLSIGQVVPHEVIGMANYNKNIFVGTGGVKGINESHFIGAAYGMERMMGRADTPLRRILNYAQDNFCKEIPIVYVLTVVGPGEDGKLAVRGIFAGDDTDCFEQACELALQANFTLVEKPFKKVVVYLDPEEFHSTWLGNKAVYRTRMALEDDAELIILGPEVQMFGEDEEIDRLIRKYGYRTTPEVMKMVEENEELRNNLSAAAHLIHGSSENRFKITYCPGHLSKEEIESVGFSYGDIEAMTKRYNAVGSSTGWKTDSEGEPYYYIDNPALGLWAHRDRFE